MAGAKKKSVAYWKTILCLANSRKQSGRCIAGREIVDTGFGAWIRPVSARETEEISEEEYRYENGQSPTVLDVIKIPMFKPKPESHQSENHLIDAGFYWQQIRRASWQEAVEASDSVPGDLWRNGYHRKNDRIPEDKAKQLKNSLLLIKPENLVIHREFNQHRERWQVRATFDLNAQHYDLSVTDPEIERWCLEKLDGKYSVSGALLCISLGEIYYEYAYKLIASILTKKRARQGR